METAEGCRAQVRVGPPYRPTGRRDLRRCDVTFDAVYRRHLRFVWRSVRRLGVEGSSIDDVVQEIFVVVHRRLDDYEARSTLKTWLLGIVFGAVRNHRRSMRRKRARQLSLEDIRPPVETGEAGPDVEAIRADGVRLLQRILAELDDDKRHVFVLAELEQYRVSEIAEMTGTNVNTVHARLRAARHRFEEAALRYRCCEA